MSRLRTALLTARKTSQVAAMTESDLPKDMRSAYAIGVGQVAHVAAWKIGGANPWSRAVFQNEHVFFGPLHPHEVFVDTDSLPISSLVSPLAEPEVMLEIADCYAHRVEDRFRRIGIGFEVPGSVLPDTLKSQLRGQVVDRAGAGALWVQTLNDVTVRGLDQELTISMQQNEQPPVSGTSANVTGGPLGAAMEFMGLAREYGIALEAGQWVATGGMCPAVPVEMGDTLTLSTRYGSHRLMFS